MENGPLKNKLEYVRSMIGMTLTSTLHAEQRAECHRVRMTIICFSFTRAYQWSNVCKQKNYKVRENASAVIFPLVFFAHAFVLNLKVVAVSCDATGTEIAGDKRERNIDLMAQMQVTSHHSPHHADFKVKCDQVKVELLLINRHLARYMYLLIYLGQSQRPVAPYSQRSRTESRKHLVSVLKGGAITLSKKIPRVISYWF